MKPRCCDIFPPATRVQRNASFSIVESVVEVRAAYHAHSSQTTSRDGLKSASPVPSEAGGYASARGLCFTQTLLESADTAAWINGDSIAGKPQEVKQFLKTLQELRAVAGGRIYSCRA